MIYIKCIQKHAHSFKNVYKSLIPQEMGKIMKKIKRCVAIILSMVLGFSMSTVSFASERYNQNANSKGICMKRNYWALLVFALIIVLQWIGLGFHGQIRFIFLIIILVLIVLFAILLRK